MNPKQRDWTSELYNRGSDFHGHGGPFMVIGLRMGLIALRLLDSKGWFGLTCKAALNWAPPDSCVLDGIQISSGCTMGKRNLTLKEGLGISAEFQSDQKKIQLTLRPEVYTEIKSILNPNTQQATAEHSTEVAANKLMAMGDDELFIITPCLSTQEQ